MILSCDVGQQQQATGPEMLILSSKDAKGKTWVLESNKPSLLGNLDCSGYPGKSV
jgi:hypothetical protein